MRLNRDFFLLRKLKPVPEKPNVSEERTWPLSESDALHFPISLDLGRGLERLTGRRRNTLTTPCQSDGRKVESMLLMSGWLTRESDATPPALINSLAPTKDTASMMPAIR